MIVFALVKAAFGATVTVCAAGCDATTIADAIPQSSYGDTIAISSGTYTDQVTVLDRELTFVAVDGPGTVVVQGPRNMFDLFGEAVITLDGLSFCPGPRALRISDDTVVTVRNAVFDGCVGDDNGIAIQARHDAVLMVTDTTIRGSDAYSGRDGAVKVQDDARGDFARVVFENNHSDNGAAIYYTSPTPWTLEDVTFAGNTAEASGGAVYWSPLEEPKKATATWTNVAFEGNQAGEAGGAVWVDRAAALSWSGGLLRGNSGGDGGAAYLSGLALVVDDVVASCNTTSGDGGAAWVGSLAAGSAWTGSIFHENTASGSGGALHLAQTDLTFVNNNVLANVAQSTGGGIDAAGGSLDVRNSVFAWNGPGTGLYAQGSTLSADYNLWFANTASHLGGDLAQPGDLGVASLVDIDPLLLGVSNDGDCFNDDATPDGASPLIDAGDPSLIDPDGSRSDIGASSPAEGECLGDPLAGDTDGDGVCDDIDLCAGDDASGDGDGDGVCDDDDVCVGDDASGDTDGDGVCDDIDLCIGDNASGDADGDGVCDDEDVCEGDDASGDSDGDGICDAAEDEDGDGSLATDDCDDADPARYPGAIDIPHDGIDQNCSGVDAAVAWGSGGGCGCQVPGAPPIPWWWVVGLGFGVRRARAAA